MSGPDQQLSQAGHCSVCTVPTDTGVLVRGTLEFVAAGLDKIGVPHDHAAVVVTRRLQPVVTALVRICGRCARRTGVPEPQLVIEGNELPSYQAVQDHQRERVRTRRQLQLINGGAGGSDA